MAHAGGRSGTAAKTATKSGRREVMAAQGVADGVAAVHEVYEVECRQAVAMPGGKVRCNGQEGAGIPCSAWLYLAHQLSEQIMPWAIARSLAVPLKLYTAIRLSWLPCGDF